MVLITDDALSILGIELGDFISCVFVDILVGGVRDEAEDML